MLKASVSEGLIDLHELWTHSKTPLSAASIPSTIIATTTFFQEASPLSLALPPSPPAFAGERNSDQFETTISLMFVCMPSRVRCKAFNQVICTATCFLGLTATCSRVCSWQAVEKRISVCDGDRLCRSLLMLIKSSVFRPSSDCLRE